MILGIPPEITLEDMPLELFQKILAPEEHKTSTSGHILHPPDVHLLSLQVRCMGK